MIFDWLTSLFKGSMAQLTFLALCIAGTVISAFSLIFGGDSDADADADHDGGDHGHEGPKMFSIRGISLFATGFGGVGYLIQRYTGKTLVASASGLLAGFLMALLGLAFIRLFFKQQANSLVQADIDGATGVVTTSIPAARGGMGEVNLVVSGSQVTRLASTDAAAEIPSGSLVKVLKAVGNIVVVEKI